MGKLQNSKLAHIQYEKATNAGKGSVGEITERYVIPTYVPPPNIKALDVTDLDEDERAFIEDAHAEYAEYYSNALKNLYSFENWLEMTKNDSETSAKIKWRTFRADNITLLD